MRIACAWWWIMPRMKSTSAFVCGVSSSFASVLLGELAGGLTRCARLHDIGLVRAVVRRVVRASAAAEQGRCGETR